jgi:hypothetical protein
MDDLMHVFQSRRGGEEGELIAVYDYRIDAAVDGSERFPRRLLVFVATSLSFPESVGKVIVDALGANAMPYLLLDLFGEPGQGGIGRQIAIGNL